MAELQEGEGCPFYFSWAGVKHGGPKCIEKLCRLWDKEENDCTFNVISKRLKNN